VAASIAAFTPAEGYVSEPRSFGIKDFSLTQPRTQEGTQITLDCAHMHKKHTHEPDTRTLQTLANWRERASCVRMRVSRRVKFFRPIITRDIRVKRTM
jgi:hypothetical protein